MKTCKYCLIAGLLALAGCDKKLDLQNPNLPTTSSWWQTESQAFAGVTGIYNALITDGTYQRSFPGLTDSRGDDFTGDSPWADLEQTGKFIIPTTSGPVEWIWRDLYMIVFRANQVIVNVKSMNATVLSAGSKDRILGQAHFLRGLAYYNLATTYKIVPVVTELPKDQEDYYVKTATEEELWNQVIADFKDAESMLPVNYDAVTGPDKGQKGAQLKVLQRECWVKHICTESNGRTQSPSSKNFYGSFEWGVFLMPDYRDNFKATNENNAESLFEVQFAAEGGTAPNWTGEPSANWRQFEAISVTYGMEGKGYSDYLPTRWIYDEFKLEKTIDGKSDPRLLATIASYEPADNSIMAYGVPWPHAQNKIYPRKYTNDGLGLPFETPENGGINYRVLRFSDIYLMYAEALNEVNGATAAVYLNIQKVRDRAKLPGLSLARPGLTKEQMRDQIAHERALEFSVESQRINDIIRWGWLYDPAKLAILKQRDRDFDTWTPGNEYLPIPQQDLNANKNLSPNPAN